MVKAIKVMLIPNNVQKTKMFQYAGASRFAYNWALAREIENYEKGGKFISDAELRKEFTKLRHSDEYAWLLNISNNVTKFSASAFAFDSNGIAKFKNVYKVAKIDFKTIKWYNKVVDFIHFFTKEDLV